MIRTFVALLATLTVGTVALMLIEIDPIRPKVSSLIAATPATYDPLETDAPLQRLKWRNMVVHATGVEGARAAEKCHFVIERSPGDHPDSAGRIRATDAWKRQVDCDHVAGPNHRFNDSSIAICLVGDFRARGPSSGQLHDLTSLVQQLQFAFQISRGHVYLYRDLDPRSQSPGTAFPAAQFDARLLRSSR